MENISDIIMEINNAQYSYSLSNDNDERKRYEEVIKEASKKILDNPDSAKQIEKHFNEGPYNLSIGNHPITRYRNESILKEIIQNILDCKYDKDININITLDDEEKKIEFEYNELGFEVKDLIAFFSLGHSNKGTGTTGAFGVGIKGAVLTCEKIEINSHNSKENVDIHFLVSHINKSGDTLEISELSIDKNDNSEDGTILKLYVSTTIYNELKQNLLDITGTKEYERIVKKLVNSGLDEYTAQNRAEQQVKKGKYLNPIEIVYASLKKPQRRINLVIKDKNIVEKYSLYFNDVNNSATFNYRNKKIEFVVYIGSKSGFKYLIPSSRDSSDEDMPVFIKTFSYNLFSTYELTGVDKGEILPKFYIDIPTIDIENLQNEDEKYYITEDRKGIQPNKINKINTYISEDVEKIIIQIKNNLYIQYENYEKKWSYLLGYLYEYILYQLKTNGTNDKWRELKRQLIKNTKLYLSGDVIELSKLTCYKYNSNSYNAILDKAIKFTNKYFMFKFESPRFRTTKFDLDIHYEFIINGKKKTIYSFNIINEYMDYYEAKSFEEFKNKNFILFDKIIYEINESSESTIYLYDIKNIKDGNEFDQEKLYSLLKVLASYPELVHNTKYDAQDGKIIVDDLEEYSLVNNTILKLMNVTTIKGASKQEEITAQKHIKENLKDNSKIKIIETRNGKLPCIIPITNQKIIRQLYNINEIKGIEELRNFLINAYIEYTLPEDWRKKSKKKILEEFVKINCNFKFDNNTFNNLKINVYIDNIKIYTIDCTDMENTYETIKNITGLTNYKLLVGENFDSRFKIIESVAEKYRYNVTQIMSYVDINKLNCAIKLFDNMFICESDLNFGKENIIVIVKNNKIIDLKQIENISFVPEESFDNIYVIPSKNQNGSLSKIGKNKFNKYIDKIFDTDNLFTTIFKTVGNPIVKLIGQFDFKLKPIYELNNSDIEILKEVFNEKTKYYNEYSGENKKYLFSYDIASKYPGYACYCSICGYDKTDVINTYQLKENIEYIEEVNTYCITIYCCANCYFESDNWTILEVRFMDSDGIYSITFSKWIEYIHENKKVETNLMKCKLKILKKSVYNIFDLNNDFEQNIYCEDKEIVLTPLMAVKWLIDNSDEI